MGAKERMLKGGWIHSSQCLVNEWGKDKNIRVKAVTECAREVGKAGLLEERRGEKHVNDAQDRQGKGDAHPRRQQG